MITAIKHVRYIDLFCGIGGFRVAMEQISQQHGVTATCMFSSDWDTDAQHTYAANFGEFPIGDITQIAAEDIPDHDLLCAGFPCQPFSICGMQQGFDDTRGTLFFDIARIIAAKRPRAFLLENVKMLVGHRNGTTLDRMLRILRDELGYTVSYRVLDSRDFGVPHKRERVFIVGFREPIAMQWRLHTLPMQPLATLLEENVPAFYTASHHIRQQRLHRFKHMLPTTPTIWHENKSGNVSAHPFSCALRAGASYNYLLVNGERRLTEREMLRLQGFPDDFKIVCGYSAMRRLTGNTVTVPCVAAVLHAMLTSMQQPTVAVQQLQLLEQSVEYRASQTPA